VGSGKQSPFRWAAPTREWTRVPWRPPRPPQRFSQQELNLGVDGAHVVRRPAGQRVVDGRVEPQQDRLPLRHQSSPDDQCAPDDDARLTASPAPPGGRAVVVIAASPQV